MTLRQPWDEYKIRRVIEADPHAERIKAGADEVGCLHCWASIVGPNHVE